MLRWKFVKFLMSILNWHFDSSSNFASFFNVLTENSPVNFKLIHFLLLIKWFYQSSNLNWTRWKFAKFLMTCLKAQVSFPSNVASIFSAIKQNFLILFLKQRSCTLFKRNPVKCKFLGFLSAQVKIRQIPHVNFELKSQFFFKFCIILHCHDRKLPCKYFF